MNGSPAPQHGAEVSIETTYARLNATPEQIAAFCRRWRIAEFALFSSVVRGDFRSDSDINVMVESEPGAHVSLWDLVRLKDEFEALFGRSADVMERGTIRNPFRRHSINRDLTVVYAA